MAPAFNLFYRSTAPDIDTVEGNLTSQNHATLQGPVFASAGDPISAQLQKLARGATNYTGGNHADTSNAHNRIDTFSIDGWQSSRRPEAPQRAFSHI